MFNHMLQQMSLTQRFQNYKLLQIALGPKNPKPREMTIRDGRLTVFVQKTKNPPASSEYDNDGKTIWEVVSCKTI